MRPNRISIVGNSGAGKTTLAREVESRLGLPRLELDSLFHQANWEPLDEPEFRSRVTAFIEANESWVIDGNYKDVRDLVWGHATTVVWLHPPRWRVMTQIGIRTLRRVLGRTQLWNGNREPLTNLYSLDPERSVMAWAWTRYPMIEKEYAQCQADPRWEHLDLRKFSSQEDALAWVRALNDKSSSRG